MREVRFIVHGNPISPATGYKNYNKFQYETEIFRQWKAAVAAAATSAYESTVPYAKSVKLQVSFYFADSADTALPISVIRHSMNGICYIDDSQIVRDYIVSSMDADRPRTEVRLMFVD